MEIFLMFPFAEEHVGDISNFWNEFCHMLGDGRPNYVHKVFTLLYRVQSIYGFKKNYMKH